MFNIFQQLPLMDGSVTNVLGFNYDWWSTYPIRLMFGKDLDRPSLRPIRPLVASSPFPK